MDFLGIGPMELILIIVIALLVLGPQKMVDSARNLGKFWREIQRDWRDTVDTLTAEPPPRRVELPPVPPPEGQLPYEPGDRKPTGDSPTPPERPSQQGSA